MFGVGLFETKGGTNFKSDILKILSCYQYMFNCDRPCACVSEMNHTTGINSQAITSMCM